jgi:hypothetical protein
VTPLTIRPPVSIGVYPADNHLCSRETCRFTGTRHVCELFRQQLTPTDFFDEDGNRLLKRASQCQRADHEANGMVYRWDESAEPPTIPLPAGMLHELNVRAAIDEENEQREADALTAALTAAREREEKALAKEAAAAKNRKRLRSQKGKP